MKSLIKNICLVGLLIVCTSASFAFGPMVFAEPVITGEALGQDNQYIDVYFSEGVYDYSSGGVLLSDLTINFNPNGSASLSSVSADRLERLDGSPLIGGEQAIRIFLKMSGGSGIPEGIELIQVQFFAGTIKSQTDTTSNDLNTSWVTLFPGICSPDPLQKVDNFKVVNFSGNSVEFEWSDPGSGEVIIIGSEDVPFDKFPEDNRSYNSGGPNFYSGEQLGFNGYVVYQGPGTFSGQITSLTPGINYFFSAFYYDPAGYCYNEQDVVTVQLNENGVTVFSGNGSPRISSLTTDGPGVPAFEFDVYVPEIVGEMNIQQIIVGLEVDRSDIQDLSSVILGAELYNDQGGGPADHGFTSSIFSNFIEFNIDAFSLLGRLNQGTTTRFTMNVWLQKGLPPGVDNKSLVFSLKETGINSSGGAPIEPFYINSSDQKNFNNIDVVATRFNMVQGISGNGFVNVPVSLQPIVIAEDIYNNRDWDFWETVTLNTTINSGSDLGPVWTEQFEAGRLDFERSADIVFTKTGTGTLDIKSNVSGLNIQASNTTTIDCTEPVITNFEMLPNTLCIPGKNGVIALRDGDVDIGSTLPPISEFTVKVHKDVYNGPPVFTAVDDGSGTRKEVGNLASGVYFIEVIHNASGCASTPLQVFVDDGTYPPIILVTETPNRLCQPAGTGDGTLTITVDSGAGPLSPGGYSFEVKNSGGLIVHTASDPSTTTASGLLDDNYTINVTDNDTNCSSTSIYVVSSQQDPVDLNVTASPNTSCALNDGSITVSASTAGAQSPGGYTFIINDGQGSEIYNKYEASGGTSTASNLPTGDYTVIVTDEETGCESNPFNITVIGPVPPSSATITSNTASTICGGEAVDLQVDITGGVGPYTIGIDNAVGTITNYTSGSPITVTPSVTTTYLITEVTDVNGCSLSPLPSTGATINVNPTPDVASSLSFSNILENSVTISLTGGNGTNRLVIMKQGSSVTNAPVNGTTYTGNATFGSGSELVQGSGEYVVYKGTGVTVNVTGLTQGVQYFVVVYDYNSTCYSAVFGSDNFTTPICPDVFANPTSQTICSGDAISIALSSSDANATFSWTASGTSATGFSGGSGNTINQTLNAGSGTTGQVTYSIISSNASCDSQPISVIITVNSPPIAFNLSGGGVLCEGSNDTAPISLSGTQNGVTYNLLLGGNQVQTFSGTGNPESFTPVSALGTYTVEATTTIGCSSTMNGSVDVTLDPLPILTGSISGDFNLCAGESGIQYSLADPGGSLTYNWTLPTGFTIVSGDGTNSIVVDVGTTASSGNISVTANNNCGTSNSISDAITVNPGFDVEIVSEVEIWANRQTQFDLNSAANITSASWDLGDGNNTSGLSVTHTYTNSGSFTVSALVTADDGCTRNASANISVGELAKVVIKNVVTPNSDGSNDVLYIENLELYPGAEVLFLDRWGKEIASFNDYQNDWDMTVKGNIIPAGNYICLVKLTDGDVFTMTVTVIK